jgi:hypothetical protein
VQRPCCWCFVGLSKLLHGGAELLLPKLHVLGMCCCCMLGCGGALHGPVPSVLPPSGAAVLHLQVPHPGPTAVQCQAVHPLRSLTGAGLVGLGVTASERALNCQHVCANGLQSVCTRVVVDCRCMHAKAAPQPCAFDVCMAAHLPAWHMSGQQVAASSNRILVIAAAASCLGHPNVLGSQVVC